MGKKPLKRILEEVNNASFELFFNRKMIITDCRYVADYSQECIVLNIGELNVKIIGVDLVLSSFVYGETCIEGEILNICFERV